MFDGGTLISAIGNNLKELLPVIVVRQYEGALRLWCGCISTPKPQLEIKSPWDLVGRARNAFRAHTWTGALGPGLWFRFPMLYTVDVIDIVADVINLPSQTYLTADHKTVTFSANIEFSIDDVVLHWMKVQNFSTSLVGVAMIHLAKRVRDLTEAELVGQSSKLEASLKTTLTTRCKDWGVVIGAVGFTDICPTKGYRFYGDPMYPMA